MMTLSSFFSLECIILSRAWKILGDADRAQVHFRKMTENARSKGAAEGIKDMVKIRQVHLTTKGLLGFLTKGTGCLGGA